MLSLLPRWHSYKPINHSTSKVSELVSLLKMPKKNQIPFLNACLGYTFTRFSRRSLTKYTRTRAVWILEFYMTLEADFSQKLWSPFKLDDFCGIPIYRFHCTLWVTQFYSHKCTESMWNIFYLKCIRYILQTKKKDISQITDLEHVLLIRHDQKPHGRIPRRDPIDQRATREQNYMTQHIVK